MADLRDRFIPACVGNRLPCIRLLQKHRDDGKRYDGTVTSSENLFTKKPATNVTGQFYREASEGMPLMNKSTVGPMWL
ncbi:MAG: hypothetical protein ACI9MJ_001001 [Alphaproteobacteria bacterium]